ncbi:MAG: acyl carrier protein [Deltaproteobacteria bacterium]|nr:acyl carrier protein [Deltaproteobacteria bacterium]MBW2018595.1 acyl carrier protein [Deltaproteobacteria bacterium]MBW2073861.1 acyl carrier protein [Deltaproteobacteria bacterium]
MRKVTREDVIKVIKEMELDVDIEQIELDGDLDKHGMDSLDMMNLFFNLEETFSVKISEESLQNQKWSTVNDIVQNINGLLAS